MDDFQCLESLGRRVWLHRDAPVWVAEYQAFELYSTTRWMAYRAIETVPAGRMPWTVDNRRIGDVFYSLDEAINAARDAAKAEVKS